jgi:adenosylmethionine-8-amino-7-oxononanoate aminotransferase
LQKASRRATFHSKEEGSPIESTEPSPKFRLSAHVCPPPFVITDAQIDRVVNILGEAIPAAVKG